MSSPRGDDVYGGNYPKARGLAFARSSGKCQFCGIHNAEEGHHWAFYDYPSGADVQAHDITALCKTCHQLATTMRDWMERKGASIDSLRREIAQCKNFTEKREALSYWIYPEAYDEGYRYHFDDPEPLDRLHFSNKLLEDTAEFAVAEPPTEEPDGWSTLGTTLGEDYAAAKRKNSSPPFLFWVIVGPCVFLSVIVVLAIIGHWGLSQ